MATDGRFSLLEERGVAPSPNGQPNRVPQYAQQQQHINDPPQPSFGDRFNFLFHEMEEDGKPKWLAPALMGGFVLMSFIAFVLGCVGVDIARANYRAIATLQSTAQRLGDAQSTYGILDCSKADIIWGQEPVKGSNAWYQVIGGKDATITWFQAMRDAERWRFPPLCTTVVYTVFAQSFVT